MRLLIERPAHHRIVIRLQVIDRVVEIRLPWHIGPDPLIDVVDMEKVVICVPGVNKRDSIRVFVNV
jgi:hypothetical protein